MYFFQEAFIFHPKKLPENYSFNFNRIPEEIYIPARDSVLLHGLLFKTDSAKGLIFYLHGNSGSLASWGFDAEYYTDLGYDIFMFDYRGFGKSDGKISDERQFYSDAQSVYDMLKPRYPESKIIIAGYSIGTGVASYLASVNRPRLLILQAPFYCLADIALDRYPFVPPFLLKYQFETYRFVANTRSRVVIFHGDADQVVPIASSDRLRSHLKPSDRFVIIKGLGHNGMNSNTSYLQTLTELLY